RAMFRNKCLDINILCTENELRNFEWIDSKELKKNQEHFLNLYSCKMLNRSNDCPVDGKWSRWSEWSSCDNICGMGKKIRYRLCNNPLPQKLGFYCLGMAHETSVCWNKCNITLNSYDFI
ncbi:unnamed protein product, partial [Gordionus sp. m RMFG-2023]